MNSMINWQVAQSQAREARRLEASTHHHPSARFTLPLFGRGSRRQ